MSEFGELLAEMSKRMEEAEEKYLFGRDIEFPVQITSVSIRVPKIRKGIGAEIGSYVSVRLVDDKKTYLGIYLGDAPADGLYRIEKETNVLEVLITTNPAMFIPDLNRVVYGYESWWGEIRSEEELREITDSDIENIWYVQALKKLSENNNQAEQ